MQAPRHFDDETVVEEADGRVDERNPGQAFRFERSIVCRSPQAGGKTGGPPAGGGSDIPRGQEDGNQHERGEGKLCLGRDPDQAENGNGGETGQQDGDPERPPRQPGILGQVRAHSPFCTFRFLAAG